MLTLHTRLRHQKELKSNYGKYLYEIEQKTYGHILVGKCFTSQLILRNLHYIKWWKT